MALTEEKKAEIEEQLTFRKVVRKNKEEAEPVAQPQSLFVFSGLVNWVKGFFGKK